MTEYHTTNIRKKFYQRIDQYRQEHSIFDSTKAFLLHATAQLIHRQKNNTMESLYQQTLKELKEQHPELENEINQTLTEKAQEQLED